MGTLRNYALFDTKIPTFNNTAKYIANCLKNGSLSAC